MSSTPNLSRKSSTSPSPSHTPVMPSQRALSDRSRPARVQTTNLALQPQSTSVPPSAVSNSSVASSSRNVSPILSPEASTNGMTRNSSIQPSPEPLRGRETEQFPPPPLMLPESIISRKTSSNSLGTQNVRSPSSMSEALKSANSSGGGLVRRVSNSLRNFRRQSSVNPNSRDVSVGPSIIRSRYRSDSNSTAPPTFASTFGDTDSDDDSLLPDKDDASRSMISFDSVSRDFGSWSAQSTHGGTQARSASFTNPDIPLDLLKGTLFTKVSKKHRGKGKRVGLLLDPEAGKIYMDRNRSNKFIYIDDIREIRVGEDTRQYRLDFEVSQTEEPRFISVLYTTSDKTKTKFLHLIADDEKIYENWLTTLDAIARHRQNFVTSLMAFNDQAIRLYWEKQMSKQLGDRPKLALEERIDLAGVEQVCRNLHIHAPQKVIQDTFKAAKLLSASANGDRDNTSALSLAQFQEFVRLLKAREDVRAVYREIASDISAGISWQDFFAFLRDTQAEAMEDVAKWQTIFAEFANKAQLENEYTAMVDLRMTEDGLSSFLVSPYNAPLEKEPQDYVLDRPLNEYIISSSHNTYLLGRQVAGISSTEGYISALVRGCRCVEIDCWDGPDGPIVVHGRTLTTQISFREVVQVVNKYAFYKSRFPLWISLEVRCSLATQEMMAKIMIEIFGEKLVREPLPGFTDRLPSPSDLKDRILIKVKKSTLNNNAEDAKINGIATRPRSSSQPSQSPLSSPTSFSVETSSIGPGSPQLGANGAAYRAAPRKINTITEGEVHESASSLPSEADSDSERDSTVKTNSKINPILGNLGVYCSGIHFDGFESPEAKSFNHIFSFKEKTFAKRCTPTEQKRALYRHNMRHMMRVYPNGSRVTSSNFDPLIYWKRGVQMAALNWQTFDLGMQLNRAMFESGTAQSGYVLKSQGFREFTLMPRYPDEWVGKRERKNVNLAIDVISAQQLMKPQNIGEKRTLDPYVEVEIFLADDKRHKIEHSSQSDTPQVQGNPLKCHTKIIRENGFNPVFDNKFNFNITTKYPDLIFVRWTVRFAEKSYTDGRNIVGSYTAKLKDLKQGYRTLPLLDHNGDQFLFSTLFCRIKSESMSVMVPDDTFDSSSKLQSIRRNVFNRSTNASTSPKSSYDSGSQA